MKAVSHHSTLCLNQGNHPSVPPEGLVLEAGKPTPVPVEMADYLRAQDCEVLGEPTATRRPAAPKNPE